MEINITKYCDSQPIGRLKVTGSNVHVTIRAHWWKGERRKQMTLTLDREEALNLVASMLCVLSDATRERTMTDNGLPGDSILRYPSYNVFDSSRNDANLARRKPVMVQEVAPGQHAMLTIDGKYAGVLTPNGTNDRAMWGLIRLPSAVEDK